MESVHIFESHDEFYHMIENQTNLLNQYPKLREFKDLLHLSKHGCPCDSEKNENGALSIYKNISTLDVEAFDQIKLLVDSSTLNFKFNDEILFTI